MGGALPGIATDRGTTAAACKWCCMQRWDLESNLVQSACVQGVVRRGFYFVSDVFQRKLARNPELAHSLQNVDVSQQYCRPLGVSSPPLLDRQ